jgi:hypothetical protein
MLTAAINRHEALGLWYIAQMMNGTEYSDGGNAAFCQFSSIEERCYCSDVALSRPPLA